MSEVNLSRNGSGSVAIITLAAAARRNALVPEMAHDLVAICDEIDADAGIGVTVVRAEGPTFCAGAHRALLADVGADPVDDARYRALQAVYDAFTRVAMLQTPVVMAVCGDAVGAGVNLVLAGDLRIMATTARLVSGFLDIGVHPGGGHYALMARLVGREATAAMSLFGVPVDGVRAHELGLVWEALPAEAVEARALELAERVAQQPELARAMTRSFRAESVATGVAWPPAIEYERAIQLWSLRNTLRLPASKAPRPQSSTPPGS